MMDISTLKFDEKGLIPAIVIDAETGKVLTLAYMNAESLKISLEKNQFFRFYYAKIFLKVL